MFIASLYNLKGGVGKTASCVNFAYMAAKDGYRTLLWDLDAQGAAGYYYNVEAAPKQTVKKIIENTHTISELIVPTQYEGLDIIPADSTARKLDIILDSLHGSKKIFKNLLKELATAYDFVFMDCAPGFSNVADNIFFASDVVLMPVIPTTLSLRTYEQVKEHFEDKKINAEKLRCFFTMVDIRKNMHNDAMLQLHKDKSFFEHYIPNLSDIERMGIKQAPVEDFAPSSYAVTCYRALWTEIKKKVLA